MDADLQAKIDQARAEGYSDEEINRYLSTEGKSITGEAVPATPVVAVQKPMDRSEEYMGLGEGAALAGAAALAGKKLIFDPLKEGAMSLFKNLATGGQPAAPAVAPGAAQAATPGAVQGMLGTAGRMAGPLGMMASPYAMAAQEQAKIRQNPNAPGLESNPYAQTIRGEAPTQRAAGAMNQRTALANMPITGVTPDQRAILEEDQKRKLALMTQVAAAKKIIGFGQ
jgi:hypothetical protein